MDKTSLFVISDNTSKVLNEKLSIFMEQLKAEKLESIEITVIDYTGDSLWKKINSALNKTDSYSAAVICEDDVIYLPALAHCGDFLSRNRDYSACYGIMGEHKSSNGFKYRETHTMPGCVKDFVIDRLREAMDYGIKSLAQAVQTTECLRASIGLLAESNTPLSDAVTIYFLMTGIPLVKGRIKRIDEFYLSSAENGVFTGSVDIAKYMISEKYSETDFSNRFLMQKRGVIDNMPVEIDRQKADLAMDYIFAKYYAAEVLRQEEYMEKRVYNLSQPRKFL